MRVLRLVSQILGALSLLILVVASFFVLRGAFRVLTYEQVDDAAHVESKREYLEQIARAEHAAAGQGSGAEAERPNVLVILFDDLGYGDLSSFGSQSIATPHIDRLAADGLRLENYYAPSPVCTSSRAAFLTGRYAPRAGLNIVAFPTGHPLDWAMKATGIDVRLPDEEILISEILQAAGYRTGMVGKWHLGDTAPALPMMRGFDSYFGALYSNDMKPFALYRGGDVAHEAPFDQSKLTQVYTQAALDFLQSAIHGGGQTPDPSPDDAPFFFYYAHNFPHIPLHAPDAERGRSQAGLYGDVVEGLDDSVGEILEFLAREGELDNTLVILTSDNGPWYEGNPGRARGRKNQTWEGGMRVPFIAHWPVRIAASQSSNATVVGVDLVPTLLSMLDLPPPGDRRLDGIDVTDLLTGRSKSLDRFVYYFGVDAQLDAVRDARFKFHRRRGVRSGAAGDFIDYNAPWGPWLFDLELDPTESYDVADRHPADRVRLQKAFDAKAAEMQTNPRGWR